MKKNVQVFSGHTGAVRCGRFTPDGKAVVTGGGEGDATLKVWDPKSGNCTGTVQGHGFHEAGEPVMCTLFISSVGQGIGGQRRDWGRGGGKGGPGCRVSLVPSAVSRLWLSGLANIASWQKGKGLVDVTLHSSPTSYLIMQAYTAMPRQCRLDVYDQCCAGSSPTNSFRPEPA